MQINFSTLTDWQHAPQVLAMMHDLYAIDPASVPPDESRFPITLQTFIARPEMGRVMLMQRENHPVGYAILIPYWSNEFGGIILVVDELFVMADYRGKGIAREFFQFITLNKPFNCVALMLEVTAINSRAKQLYDSVGFKPRSNTSMTKIL